MTRSDEGWTRRAKADLVDDAGDYVVGFMLVFPVVLMLTFGVFQFAMWALAAEEIHTAARDGARRAAIQGGTIDDASTLIKAFVHDGTVIEGGVAVTGSRGAVETTVTVTGNCRWLIDAELWGNPCEISKTVTVPTEEFEPGVRP